MPPEPSHEQLNVYVHDEWKNPLPATVRVHVPGESEPPEIETSGQPNKPAKFRIPKGIPRTNITSANVSITCKLPKRRATRSAKHSRVYSSITTRTRSARPSCVIAFTKS